MLGLLLSHRIPQPPTYNKLSAQAHLFATKYWLPSATVSQVLATD